LAIEICWRAAQHAAGDGLRAVIKEVGVTYPEEVVEEEEEEIPNYSHRPS
jgi:hypothetical protein